MGHSPIFIMSSERSGSNLLRILLSNHSNIAGPTAPHLLLTFSGLIPYYGSLTDKKNARKIFEDIMEIVNHPYHSWGLKLDFEKVYEKYRPHRFLDFVDLVYNEVTLVEKKKRYLCKENNIFEFTFQLLNYFKNPHFIYLYRDPRDYAASWLKLEVGPRTPFDAAMRWLTEQRTCDILINSFELQVYKVKYEELITNTDEVIVGILRFLQEPVQEACFGVQRGKHQHLTWNKYWKNLDKPIIKDNFKNYLNVFKDRQINIIESVTKDYMIKLGYTLDTHADWRLTKHFNYKEAYLRKIIEIKRRLISSPTYRLLEDRKVLLEKITNRLRRDWLESTNSYEIPIE